MGKSSCILPKKTLIPILYLENAEKQEKEDLSPSGDEEPAKPTPAPSPPVGGDTSGQTRPDLPVPDFAEDAGTNTKTAATNSSAKESNPKPAGPATKNGGESKRPFLASGPVAGKI